MRGERGVQTRIWTLSPLKEFARFSNNAVKRVLFSPDGSCFATTGSLVASSVRIWRTTDGQEVTAIQQSEPDGVRRGVALDPSGEFLVMPGTADEAWVCSLEGGRKLATVPHRGIERVALSRGNECIVTAGGKDGVRMWRLSRTSGRIAGVADPVALKDIGEVAAMCLTEDGTRLMTCGRDDDRAIRIWNTVDGQQVTSIPHRLGAEVDSIACSADGALFAVEMGPDESTSILRTTERSSARSTMSSMPTPSRSAPMAGISPPPHGGIRLPGAPLGGEHREASRRSRS